ncbi:hypothetical protein [Actinomyces glycerinitolerans]|uniref:Prokaryotic membrane lipoprotein lipid attachment site profile n=1 Tax=Actinomyces glycerinitolerans TaxID=1892869 RepID=A0A1M4S3N0_9ACTO|nr:hypothetical protein [Actinomyces glycerinitolerans]SHE26769.1 Hypothetical protein ACGLYG10_3024 [Actinomyces glycerinitolerans]
MPAIGRRNALRATLIVGAAATGIPVLIGCSASTSSGGSGTPSVGSDASRGAAVDSVATPAPSSDASAEGELLTPRDDLVSPSRIQWDSWRLIDPTTVEVSFVGGSPTCEGVSVELRETPQDVTINLSTGVLPEMADGDCPAIAVLSAVRVTLSEDLGEREVRQDDISE